MSKPRQGDYHLAEVRRVTAADGRPAYQAYCRACGWVGMQRSLRASAEDDAYAHDYAEND